MLNVYTVEKITRINPVGTVKAFVDLSVNDELMIRNIRIVDTGKGCFVSFPNEKNPKSGRFYDVILFRNPSDYQQVNNLIIEAYKMGDL